ncbi:MAG: thermonuclease family protein [Candidatus Peribacteraceae bacterium]|nr:thermonuclease family protein [Candidatus Peribacteraceae bacterium]
MGNVKAGVKIEGYTGFENKNLKLILMVMGLIVLYWISMYWMVSAMATDGKSATQYNNISNVEFIRNYDGDTITVNIEGWPDIIGHKMPIRVLGVDTPERRGKCQKEKDMAIIVKNFVYNELSNARNISIINPSRGKYYRIVGDIQYDDKLLSNVLLLNQYAYPYLGGTKKNPWCEETP